MKAFKYWSIFCLSIFRFKAFFEIEIFLKIIVLDSNEVVFFSEKNDISTLSDAEVVIFISEIRFTYYFQVAIKYETTLEELLFTEHVDPCVLNIFKQFKAARA